MPPNEAVIEYAEPKLLHKYFRDTALATRVDHIYSNAIVDKKMSTKRAIAHVEKTLAAKGEL